MKTFTKKLVRFFSYFLICAILALAFSSCSFVDKRVVKNRKVKLPSKKTFRINYKIHDPDGNDITDEIMKTDLDRWMLFVESCNRAKVAFEELGYELIYDPDVPADFIVDVGFSAFYSDKISEEEMYNQPPATLLMGMKDDDFFYHYAVLTILTKDPKLSSDEFIVVWEGKGVFKSESDDIRDAEFTIMTDLLEEFPEADLRR